MVSTFSNPPHSDGKGSALAFDFHDDRPPVASDRKRRHNQHGVKIMKSIGADLIYTGTGIRRNAWLNFRDQEIVSLTEKPVGEDIGRYPVLTPAFVDPHCNIGMERAGEPGGEGEAN
jgi:imidazolonepropionase-like amidohydrolase